MSMNLPFSFLLATAESTNSDPKPLPLGAVMNLKVRALQMGPSFTDEVELADLSIDVQAAGGAEPISVMGHDGSKLRQVLAVERLENDVTVVSASPADGSVRNGIGEARVLPLTDLWPRLTMEVGLTKTNDSLSRGGQSAPDLAPDLAKVASARAIDPADGNAVAPIMRGALADRFQPEPRLNRPQMLGGLRGETIVAMHTAGGLGLAVAPGPKGEVPVKAGFGPARAEHLGRDNARIAPLNTHHRVAPKADPKGTFSAEPANQTAAATPDPNQKVEQNLPMTTPPEDPLTELSQRPPLQPQPLAKHKFSTAELTSLPRAPIKQGGPPPTGGSQHTQVNSPQEIVVDLSLPSPTGKMEMPPILIQSQFGAQPSISLPPLEAREDPNIQAPRELLRQAVAGVSSAPPLPSPPLRTHPATQIDDALVPSVTSSRSEAGALTFEGASASVPTSPTAPAVPGPPMIPTTALMQVRLAAEPFSLGEGEDTSLLAIEGERRAESGSQALAPQRAFTSAPATPTLTAQFRDAIGASVAAQRSIEIALKPEELGTVRMTLTPSDSGGSISILVERPETLELVQRHLEALRRELRDAGWAHAELSVSQDNVTGGGSNPDGDGAAHGQAERGAFAPAMREAPGTPSSHSPLPATSGLDLRI
jgi:flagellar hook-length control protein FliK